MESSRFYTAAEIDKLKQKVVAYKNLLTTLKLGASLEDYLFIKNEFEELKMQMSHVEPLKDDVDKNQFEQVEKNENQVKQVSVQLDSLNQMVEEVLSTLNKVVLGEAKKEQVEEITFPRIITQMNEAKPHDKQVDNVISEPTYSQLRNLAGQVMYQQKNEEPIQTIQNNDYPLDSQHQQRHFNHRYFQSINTQPNNIYNGLYKNIQMKTSSRLEDTVQRPKRMNGIINEAVAPTLHTNYLQRPNIQPFISNEMENPNTYIDKFNGATPRLVEQPPAPAIAPQLTEQLSAPTIAPEPTEQQSASTVTSKQTEQPPAPAITPQQVEQSSVPAVTSEQTEQQSEPIIQSEETLSSEVEKKKQKSSSFFGFFRK